jgi:hypothetical protein
VTNPTDPPKPPIPGAPYLGYGSFDALVDARPDLFDGFDCRPPSESRTERAAQAKPEPG